VLASLPLKGKEHEAHDSQVYPTCVQTSPISSEIGDVCTQATLLHEEKKKGEKRRNEEASFQIKTTFNYRLSFCVND